MRAPRNPITGQFKTWKWRHQLRRFFRHALPLGALLAVIFGGFFIHAHVDTSPEASCTVESKDRGGKDGSMRVYTDCGVFSVADMPFGLHFSSADVYASLEGGTEYAFETRGIRIPLLSQFPNVIEATETVGPGSVVTMLTVGPFEGDAPEADSLSDEFIAEHTIECSTGIIAPDGSFSVGGDRPGTGMAEGSYVLVMASGEKAVNACLKG